ncbi:MAG: hypothetical protein WC437_04810 [Patescibacteria group bacterium]
MDAKKIQTKAEHLLCLLQDTPNEVSPQFILQEIAFCNRMLKEFSDERNAMVNDLVQKIVGIVQHAAPQNNYADGYKALQLQPEGLIFPQGGIGIRYSPVHDIVFLDSVGVYLDAFYLYDRETDVSLSLRKIADDAQVSLFDDIIMFVKETFIPTLEKRAKESLLNCLTLQVNSVLKNVKSYLSED